MEWDGRQLKSANKNGNSLSFVYNSDGIRLSKTMGSTTTKYLLNGTQILAQTTNGKTLCFFYDQQGNRIGMADGSNKFYYYIYNLQGDVIALADASTGKLAATYTYDAWGKCTVTNASGYTIGTQNPFRYRGYYYDTETGLYYLNSRYYDPEVGRFISVDGQLNGGSLGCNMFAYCENDPVNRTDDFGSASYKNSYKAHKINGAIDGYNVTTTITIGQKKLTFKYYIRANGVIQFLFTENNYWRIYRTGSSRLLAKAMYDVAKKINKKFLKGRTVGGLDTELKAHWVAYNATGFENARRADMGSTYRYGRGYDSNAWIWETLSTSKEFVSKINIICGKYVYGMKYAITVNLILRFI